MKFIPFTPVRAGLVSCDENLTWFEPSDPFSNKLAVLLADSGDDQVATVFYAGRPVLTVGPPVDEHGTETVDHIVGLERDAQQIYVMFLQTIGEMPAEYELEDGTVLDDPAIRVAEGENYWDIADQYDGQGYEICAFVDQVVEAVNTAGPSDG